MQQPYYRFPVIHVRVLRNGARVVHFDAKFAQKVLGELVTSGQLECARIQDNLLADIEVLDCVECVVVRRRPGDAVPAD